MSHDGVEDGLLLPFVEAQALARGDHVLAEPPSQQVGPFDESVALKAAEADVAVRQADQHSGSGRTGLIAPHQRLQLCQPGLRVGGLAQGGIHLGLVHVLPPWNELVGIDESTIQTPPPHQ